MQSFPTTLVNFYKTWKEGTEVALSYNGKVWKIKGNRVGKKCRLGRGWTKFITDNDFVVGEQLKLRFVACREVLFEVSKVV